MFLFNAFCAFILSFFLLTGCNNPSKDDTASADSSPIVFVPYYMDEDGDGYTTETDCNDADATIHPGAFEVTVGERVDEDCDGLDETADIYYSKAGEEYCERQYYISMRETTWDEALAECRTHPGYDLEKESSKWDMEWMAYVFTHYHSDAEWWIGLNDQETEGKFVWADGTSPVEGRFDFENPNSPEKDCAFYFKEAEIDNNGVDNGYTESQAFIAPCEEKRVFVCQETADSWCDN